MTQKYSVAIGLEIHVELSTVTKMFCASKNDAHEGKPNVNVCPICLAHPGTLPVINMEAVHRVLQVGAALGGTLATYTEFDRKNYFYPDLPKGYQISQYAFPLVSGGLLNEVAITRVHLEEDTASSIHNAESGATHIDYNRAGVPLMELVTEPVIQSAEQAGKFAEELQLLLRYLGASNADMEKGEMRLEANISVSDSDALGTKVEVKNINSFRAMERSIAFEIRRQTSLLESGGAVVQETRGWDDARQETFSQRTKEVAADYRYFPDPDLPSLLVDEYASFSLNELQKALPELPAQRRARYVEFGLKPPDADQFVAYPVFGDFFDAVVEGRSDSAFALTAANYISNDLVSLGRDTDNRDSINKHDISISVENFRTLIDLVVSKRVSSRVAKDLLVKSASTGGDPESIASAEGLFQSAGNVDAVIKSVLDGNSRVVADFKAGKSAAFEYLVGLCMRELKGAADVNTLREKLKVNLQNS